MNGAVAPASMDSVSGPWGRPRVVDGHHPRTSPALRRPVHHPHEALQGRVRGGREHRRQMDRPRRRNHEPSPTPAARRRAPSSGRRPLNPGRNRTRPPAARTGTAHPATRVRPGPAAGNSRESSADAKPPQHPPCVVARRHRTTQNPPPRGSASRRTSCPACRRAPPNAGALAPSAPAPPRARSASRAWRSAANAAWRSQPASASPARDGSVSKPTPIASVAHHANGISARTPSPCSKRRFDNSSTSLPRPRTRFEHQLNAKSAPFRSASCQANILRHRAASGLEISRVPSTIRTDRFSRGLPRGPTRAIRKRRPRAARGAAR